MTNFLGRPRTSTGRSLKALAFAVGLVAALSITGLGVRAANHSSSLEWTAGTRLPALASSGPSVCNLGSLNPLVFDSLYAPDILDPQVTFSIPGWGAVQQAYQTLVVYNQSSPTEFVPVLAANWTVSPDQLTYTFHLRPGVHFSNGDPFNAYAMWFSLYRGLVLNQSPQFILSQEFWFPGVTYYSPASQQLSAEANLTNELNTFDFQNPTASELAVMMAAGQSFVVLDNLKIALNVGSGYLGMQPYAFLLAILATPIASAVDPAVIQAHGGVSGSVNAWMTLNMLGTGPYVLSGYNLGVGYALAPDPNYWGAAASLAAPWNNALPPAHSGIVVNFVSSPASVVLNLETGAAAGVTPGTIDAQTARQLSTSPCVVMHGMDPVYGSSIGGWWVYMNQNVLPFNNLFVRQAIVHAINYDEIINMAFGGYAQRWVGPVPPGYPYYNPPNLAPYSHDLALARQAMNNSPWPLPAGYPATVNFPYLDQGDWATAATLLEQDLAQIGIKINPVPVTLATFYYMQTRDSSGVCLSQTASGGGPFPIGLDFWTSDYLSPDDWAQEDALSYGIANDCMAGYSNATVDAAIFDAMAQSSASAAAQDYSLITQAMYANYTDAWLVIPTQFEAYHPSLRGIVPNPMGQAAEYSLTLNALYAVRPLAATLSANPSTAQAGSPVVLNATVVGGTPPYSFGWDFGDGTNTTGTVANGTHTYSASGNFTAILTVRDTYGGYSSTSLRVTVIAAPAPPSSHAPETSWFLYAGIAAVAAAVAVFVAFVLLRRRRGGAGRQTPPPPGVPPPVPPP